MDQSHFTDQTRANMSKALEVLKNDLSTIRTGRAAPALIEHVIISAYDGTAMMKMPEMATVTAQDNRTLVVTPFDGTQIRAIEKAITEANLGVNPTVDGQIIRISIPPLTEERREEYIKLAKVKIEGGRVMVRQVRHEAMNDIKKSLESAEINEDDKEHLEKEVQTITDKTISDIDALLLKKEEELRQL